MDIHNYRKRLLTKPRHIINFFLGIALSLMIVLLVGVGFLEATFQHFDDRGNVFAEEISGLLSETTKEFILQEMKNTTISENIPQGDLCQSDYINQLTPEMRIALQQKCADGPLYLDEDLCEVINPDDVPAEFKAEFEEKCILGEVSVDDLAQEIIDLKVNEFTEDMKPDIEAKYNESIDNGKVFLTELKRDYPLLKMEFLTTIFCILLLLFFFNNDLPLTINYISKKLMMLVPIVFFLPYILFRYEFIGIIFNKADISKLIVLPLPINPSIIVEKSVEIISTEMSLFYSQFLPFAFVAFFAGIVLWYGNKKFLIPFSVKRHGFLHPEIPTKSPLVNIPVRDNAGPKIMTEKERRLQQVDIPKTPK